MDTLLSTGQASDHINIADHVNAMLAYWDKDLICRYANAAYLDWFGKTSYELIDKMTMQDLLGPLFKKNKPYILGVLAGFPQTFEREIVVPGGTKRHAIANYFPDNADGEVVGFYVHVADVTPIKIVENELNRSTEIIKRQNAQLLNFANIISHNFNNYASSFESILTLFINADSAGEKEEFLIHLKNLSKSFSLSLKNIRKVVHLQNHGLVQGEWVVISESVEHILEILENQLKQDHIIIVNRVSSGFRIWANVAYVESIITNLLTNAVKYRHPDRIAVIELISAEVGGMFSLKIRDNGLGLDLKRHSNQLFGLYNTFHGNADAEGVGLYMTKMQIESIGGHIEVESEVNQGTTFTVYFLTEAPTA